MKNIDGDQRLYQHKEKYIASHKLGKLAWKNNASEVYFHSRAKLSSHFSQLWRPGRGLWEWALERDKKMKGEW